tara:strand:+ start:2290 stop:2805 length:516 start_codon:yes stop_codon:yes gene_type:complete
MFQLNTSHYTSVYSNYLIDPYIIDYLIKPNNKKRNKILYDYTGCFNPYCNFIRDVSSGFLDIFNCKHNKYVWYMDVIRYNLENDVKGVNSGLAWHCENDNYTDVITVLMYLTIDDGIKDGNIRYKDKNSIKRVLHLKGGTTIIMDGDVQHKPQDPYGSGKRDLIIMSFEKC